MAITSKFSDLGYSTLTKLPGNISPLQPKEVKTSMMSKQQSISARKEFGLILVRNP